LSASLNLNLNWSHAWPQAAATALLRCTAEDFEVEEQLPFTPEGEGEHACLFIEKRGHNTQDIIRRLSRFSGVAERDIGYCGLKDRHAVTRQWFSVGLAGKDHPLWNELEEDGLRVLKQTRHARKLRRGVHSGNRFKLVLRELSGDRDVLEQRLQQIRSQGVPNYFGEQRFGIDGGNLHKGLHWLRGEGRQPRRQQRSMYLSALRSYLFNKLLAVRVEQQQWQQPLVGDVCMLSGSNSLFCCEQLDDSIRERAQSGDLSLGLPLWGSGETRSSQSVWEGFGEMLSEDREICDFLVQQKLGLAWRSARLFADDFCWQFCDDDRLILEFSLESGCFATALLRELVNYTDNKAGGGSSE
jgi:tRNA pseudouridine13 synthase